MRSRERLLVLDRGMSPLKKPSRRLVRNALLVLLAVVSVVLAVCMTHGDLDSAGRLATVVGLFVALASLAATVIGFPLDVRPTPSASDLADDLAHTVQDQWYEEARVRRLRDPKVLPLTWSSGRMDGKFDEVTHQLADGYRQVRSERLVVLGEPGSGKTVLAILLTLGLLNSRRTGSPVPVLLAVSSWDPIQESMDDWVIRTVATLYYNGQQDSPRALLDHGLLLPILDGLDEIPESARRSAVRRINEAIGVDRPVVVTCRSAEYEDVIEGGAPVLRQAPVVRVMPVAVADVIAYLKAVPTWPNGTTWRGVFDDLEQRPDSPLAAALSTPLMVSLARTIYQRCGGDPAELLDAKTFGSRHTIEDYLIDRVVDAAYAPDLLPSGELATAPASRWDATMARRWLTFLARYLHQYRERDLAWWRLSDRLVSPWMAPGIGIGLGVALMITVSAGTATVNSIDLYPQGASGSGAAVGLLVALVVAVLGTMLWYGGVGSAPGRMAFAVRGSLGRLRRGFAAGATLVAILAASVLFGIAVTIFIGSSSGGANFSDIRFLVQALMVAVAVASVVGFAVAAHNWLNALPERSTQASPFSFVQQDRRSSLAGALAAGLVAGLTVWPAFAVAMLTGTTLGQGIAGGLGKPGITGFAGDTTGLDASLIQVIGIAVLSGMVVVLLVLLTRAWPRFVLARAILAARGNLPWRLLTFLADARDRELLRQSGGMYQFRHIRLQERLATSPGVATTGAQRQALTPTTAGKRRRTMAMAGAVVIATSAVITLSTFNYLRCDSSPLHLGTDVDQVRAFGTPGSWCIGIIPEKEWDQRLGSYHEVLKQLSDGNDAAKGKNVVMIAVIGALSAGDPKVIIRQLDGVVLAQTESQRLGRPVHVVLVDTVRSDSESEDAAVERAVSFISRSGFNMPAMVTLGDKPALVTSYNGIPIFSAAVRYDPYGSPPRISDTLGRFDQQLQESQMRWFIQYTLKTRAILEVDTFTLDSEYAQKCAIAGRRPVLVQDGQIGPVEPLLYKIESFCGNRDVQLATTDSRVAGNLPAQQFPNLTIYYPIAEATPTARPHAAVQTSVPKADMTELSHQATLNAAGNGHFVICKMKADQNQWVTTPFAPVVPLASSPCATPH